MEEERYRWRKGWEGGEDERTVAMGVEVDGSDWTVQMRPWRRWRMPVVVQERKDGNG